MVYSWQNYAYKVPAQKVGEALEQLEEKEGTLTVDNIVKAASSKKSVLHPLFEWDDKVAAAEYRKTQAGNVLRCLVVKDEESDREPHRAFVAITSKGVAQKGVFINIQSALEDEETRDIVLSNALLELKAFQKKYKDLSELAAVFAEIDKIAV